MTAPIDVQALTQAAVQALAKGEPTRARDLLQPVIDAKRADVSTWLAMADVRGVLGDSAGKLAAIDQALGLKPNELRALIAKADHLAGEGQARAAAAFYSAALQYAPRFKDLAPYLQDGLRRAKAANEGVARELEDFIRAKLASEGLGGPRSTPRFQRALDILIGKKRAFVQQPQYLFYPELPQIQFYERDLFPWLDQIEAATGDIRAELKAAIGGFTPYVTQEPGRPKRDDMGLLDNPSWGAFFLYKDGAEQAGAARCPRTMEALAGAPLTRIPNRAPSILFSKLAAGAQIPPHTGMINARLICHLPLIVPPECEFRVGNDVRAWVEGKAWAFDDTIEHQAWNKSGQDRYILLFDVWRPELAEDERAGVVALCQAIDQFGAKAAWNA